MFDGKSLKVEALLLECNVVMTSTGGKRMVFACLHEMRKEKAVVFEAFQHAFVCCRGGCCPDWHCVLIRRHRWIVDLRTAQCSEKGWEGGQLDSSKYRVQHRAIVPAREVIHTRRSKTHQTFYVNACHRMFKLRQHFSHAT